MTELWVWLVDRVLDLVLGQQIEGKTSRADVG